MSDAFVPAAPSSEAPAPEATPTTTETPASESAPAESYQFSGSVEEASAEIRRLRDENAQRRLSSKPYDEAFNGFSSEEKEAWLQLGRLFKDSPEQAREAFRQLAQIEAQQQQAVQEQGTEAQPLTRDDLLSILNERDSVQARQVELSKIDVETAQLGLKPDSVEYEAVLQLALSRTNGDIKAAHEMFEKAIQGRVQSALDSLKNAPQNTPPVNTDGGPAVSNEPQAPKTLKEARQRAMAFLQAQQQQS